MNTTVVLVLHSGMLLIGEQDLEQPQDSASLRFKLLQPAQIVKTRVQVSQGLAVVESFEFLPVPHLHFLIDTPGGIVMESVARKYLEARAVAHGVVVPRSGHVGIEL